jgi:hypothetical protein
MLFVQKIFVGIDPSGGRQPFSYAALDEHSQLLATGSGELEDVLAYLGGQEAALVAVNAPHRPNLGLVRKKMERESLTPAHLRGADLRMAEYELRQRGIAISPTPGRADTCPVWMQIGFEFFHRLEALGYTCASAGQGTHLWLETHPHAVYCALLGQVPLPKPTLEGRLQRQLALYENGLGIQDPMEFFEEITRHKLLNGVLPTKFVYAPELLDALAAALVAFRYGQGPDSLAVVGDRAEGQIHLPVTVLKERYL